MPRFDAAPRNYLETLAMKRESGARDSWSALASIDPGNQTKRGTPEGAAKEKPTASKQQPPAALPRGLRKCLRTTPRICFPIFEECGHPEHQT